MQFSNFAYSWAGSPVVPCIEIPFLSQNGWIEAASEIYSFITCEQEIQVQVKKCADNPEQWLVVSDTTGKLCII